MMKGIRIYLRACKTVLTAVPKHILAAFILVTFLEGIFTGLGPKVTQNFFDTVGANAAAGGGFRKIAQTGLLLGGFIMMTHIFGGLTDIMAHITHRMTSGILTQKSNLKTGRVDPIYFDDPAFLDDIEKMANAVPRLSSVFRLTVSTVFMHLTNCVIMGWYLYSLDPILAIMPVVVFVPIIFTHFARSGAFSKMEDAAAPIRRETRYYQECIGHKDFFKETRVLGAYGYFKNLYTSALDILNIETWRAEKKGAWLDLISKFISLTGFAVVLFLLVRSVTIGTISIGAFAAVFASVGTLFNLLEELFLYEFGWVSREFKYLENYFRYMDLPERTGDQTPVTLTKEIKVSKMNFRYPGKEADALKDINLTIPAGETLAIVGENGSGKSTLVKLLLGLYLPDSGTVSYDGRNIAHLSAQALTHKTSAVFQDYMRYKLTIKDNAAISDLTAAERDCGYGEEVNSLLRHTTDDKASGKINELLVRMDIDCRDDKYPEGINTLLDREFGGIDLSGGQWQKIAIARGLYRNYHLIALDEPTAAIDPIEEGRLYRRFMEISRGVTSLIVTHRLGSVRIADRILVMDGGRVVQTGTHDELVNMPGKYAQMWHAQAKHYH